MKRLIVALGGLCLLAASPAAFAIDAPDRKPQPTYKSSVLNRSDSERVFLGLQAARDGDWRSVRGYRQAVGNRVGQKLLLWREVTSSQSSSDFDTLDRALRELEGWPRLNGVRVQAEEAIGNSRLTPTSRIQWLERFGPISGEGKIALSEAYQTLGRREDAERLIRDAWHNHSFLVSRQREIARKHANILNEADHIRRADYLLWSSQRSAASAMKSYLPNSWDRLVDARIALASGSRGVDRLINAVPSSLADNAGLLYERSNWRRKRGRWADARPLLLQINPAGIPEVGLRKIWDEKNLHMRRAIREDEHSIAYQLAATHGMTSGVDFAEGEFNAGWVALRYLNRPQDALRHFQTLEAGVSSPVSKSRAQFWTGEALTRLNRTSEARQAYGRGARHLTTFYGQRSAERIGATQISLPPKKTPTQIDRDRFEQRELVQALRMLAEAGETFQFRRVAYFLDDTLQTDVEYELLFDLAESYNLTQVGVRGSKAGLFKGVVATGAAYPQFPFDLPGSARQAAEPALVIALSRQESELNAKAISSARAYGLMQMLNSTARMQARSEGVSYRRSWLLDDPIYNVTLGRAHLSDLIEQFDGSYILAIAAYNAGASRPRRWVQEYGDPRRGEIDPIDFIESIPFSETRNYVQRVLENTQVYRHVLARRPVSIELERDLKR